MALMSITELRELRDMMTHEELWSICRDAATYAVRAPYTTTDRDDCGADVYGDIVTVCHGAMPRRDSELVLWTAVRNRAMNWRRAEDARRERDAMMSGADSTSDERPEDSAPPAAYLAAGAAQDAGRARTAAAEACRALSVPPYIGEHPSGAFLLMYQWARDVDGATAAAELEMTHAAYRQRTSRAAREVRGSYSLDELVSRLMGAPVVTESGEVLFALRDDSREAHGHTPLLARDPRTRPDEDAPIVKSHTAPDADAPARRAAAELDRERRRAHARRTLGALSQRRPEVHAGTGARRVTVGRTSGKAPEKYAPRAERLGDR